MSPRPTILFHPQNHVGLGHVNRLAAIALAVAEIDPSVRTPFVIEGAHHLHLDALDIPYVPLPSVHLMNETAGWIRWTDQERSNLTQEIGRAIIATLKPQLVVFDCMPDRAFASVILQQELPVVLCLRETRDLARYVERLEFLLPHVELILIPHDPNEVLLPEPLARKSCFVGKIARQMSFAAADTSQRSGGGKKIVISGGGGGYPGTVAFYNLALSAMAELHLGGLTAETQLIAGPLFTDWQKLELVGGVRVVPYDPNLAQTFAEADLVICQAGYNTVAELNLAGTRVVLVPAPRKWDDQITRAQRMVQENLQFRILQTSSPKDLATLVAELLRQPLPQRRVPAQAQGAQRAAEKLCAMLRS